MRLRGGALALLLGACMPAADHRAVAPTANHARGELGARPQADDYAGTAGEREIAIPGAEPALLYVPASYRRDAPMPLLLMLHGAGGTARHSVDLASRYADRFGFIILAPASRAATWDVIAGRAYGPDVTAIDAALAQSFAGYAVDRSRVAIGGFSDGASYALSLGLANGELFGRILAFSPGFVAPGRQAGRPHIFISYGVADRVLPIEATSRRIVPRLRDAGYHVDYEEFRGGHIVPAELASPAFESWVAD
jgi:phospholipase/carboxylesterase